MTQNETSDQSQSTIAAVPHDAAVFAAAGLLCTGSALVITRESLQSLAFPLPYVWTDVAAVYFVCALPAARLLQMAVVKHARGVAAAFAATAVLASALLAATFHTQDQWWFRSVAVPQVDALLRTGFAVVVATAALTVSPLLLELGFRRVRLRQQRVRYWNSRPIGLWLASVLFAALVPAAYLESRCNYFQAKLAEYVSQYRLGQARRLADQLDVLSPEAPFAGGTIRKVAQELDDRVRQIERQVALPLPATSSVEQRLERARLHAVLGQVEEARSVLQPLVVVATPHPAACVLLGTAHESREDWETSLAWYVRARDSLQRHGPSRQTQPVLLKAIKGIAYTQRKLGHYREAEAAYLQALELSPTADVHFLLAQFYEDGQQAAKAHRHVLRAVQLDRQRYGAPGQEMIDKLLTDHFGCLSVFVRSRDAAGPPW